MIREDNNEREEQEERPKIPPISTINATAINTGRNCGLRLLLRLLKRFLLLFLFLGGLFGRSSCSSLSSLSSLIINVLLNTLSLVKGCVLHTRMVQYTTKLSFPPPQSTGHRDFSSQLFNTVDSPTALFSLQQYAHDSKRRFCDILFLINMYRLPFVASLLLSDKNNWIFLTELGKESETQTYSSIIHDILPFSRRFHKNFRIFSFINNKLYFTYFCFLFILY